MNTLEDQLNNLIDAEYYAYLESCDEKHVDADSFAEYVTTMIEDTLALDKFADFNVHSYAKHYVESKGDE